jgi:1-acyl-sn-glycerol-3-phosphate acyltransferase
MIYAKHHMILYPFFRNYVLLKMKKSFSAIEIFGNLQDDGKPLLCIANHTSWWDGIWVLYSNEKRFRRKFHFMMLEEQLRKNWFFRYTGGFSIKKGSRSVLESLKYAATLLNDPQNMVLMFPQGEIQSMHRHLFRFEKGIETILRNCTTDVQVIFQVNLIDYLSSPKPGLYQYLTTYNGNPTHTEMEDAYNRFYAECLTAQSAKTS